MKYQNIAIVVFAVLAATLFLYDSDLSSNGIQKEFQHFKDIYGKSYSKQEELYRIKIYISNKNLIQTHNSDPTQTYKMEINSFADLTSQEFKNTILMNKLVPQNKAHIIKETKDKNYQPLISVDWRDKGVVTDVKNQGGCGSCWSFSTTGALQSAIAIYKNQKVSLSQKQLVDCCGQRGYQCLGCNGAWPVWALDYIKDTGIVTQSQYTTYDAKQAKCRDNQTDVQKNLKKYLKSYVQLDPTDQSLMKGVAQNGPVSICLDASNWAFYKSGIFSNCGTIQNHAVLLVGYDDNRWIVKNSWGTNWGESGYINIAKNNGSACGLKLNAVVPFVN